MNEAKIELYQSVSGICRPNTVFNIRNEEFVTPFLVICFFILTLLYQINTRRMVAEMENQRFIRRVVLITVFSVSVGLIIAGSCGLIITHNSVNDFVIPAIEHKRFLYIILIVIGILFLIADLFALPKIFRKIN